jgi:hypothetical protein
MNHRVNANTPILIILTIAVTLAGWGLNRAYNDLAQTQREIKDSIMPKQEIQLQLDALRVRISAIEVEVSKIKK